MISSAGALLSGLAALDARRVAIVTPYMKPLTAAVVAYLEDAGVEVVDSLSLEVPDNLAVARLDPADLREHYKKLDLSRADALVLSCCVQMPSLPVVQAVQDEVGHPRALGGHRDDVPDPAPSSASRPTSPARARCSPGSVHDPGAVTRVA